MSYLDWPSDGIMARLALIMFGVIILLIVLHRFRRQPVIARMLPAALLWHFAIFAFTVFWMLPYYAVQTGADSYGYHSKGLEIAQEVRAGEWSSIPWGASTEATDILTGFVYVPFGGDVYGMAFFSAVLGLCGCLYFCLAFSIWANPAQTRRYSLIILFLPSFAMWTGMLGKDSWIALGLGLAAYGYSSMLKGAQKKIWHFVLGLAIITLIRPHISVTFAAAAVMSYVWNLTKRNRNTSILAKTQIVLMLVVMFVGLAWVAQRFLGLDQVSVDSVDSYAEAKGAGNAIGGSAVEVTTSGGVSGTIRGFPAGIVRVLFQPFPWEVHNVNSGLAAIENLFILWFTISHLRLLRKLMRASTRGPYVLFSCILSLGLLLILSLMPNFGLLSRERAQLLPFVFAPLVASEALRKRAEQFQSFGRVPQSRYNPRRLPADQSALRSS